jgi:biotin carboxylase
MSTKAKDENRLFIEEYLNSVSFDWITVDSDDYNDVIELWYAGWHTDYFNLGLF